MRHKKVVSVVATILILGISTTLIWIVLNGRSETGKNYSTTDLTTSAESQTIGTNTPEPQTQKQQSTEPIDSHEEESITVTLDLLVDCPDPSADLSEECETALDTLFAEKNIGHLDYHWITFENPMTYERVFKSPIKDRERVLEALNNPACQISNQIGDQTELHNECHAEAFLNLFHFTRMCLNPDSYENRYDYWFTGKRGQTIGKYKSRFDSRLETLNLLPAEERTQRTTQLWEEVLESRWIVKQCEQFQVEEILIDPARDLEIFEKLRSAGTRLDVNDQIDQGYEIRQSLKAIAARLGEPAAVIIYDGSPEWRTFRTENYPWIQSNQELLQSDATRESRLAIGVQIATKFAESGWEFDWEFLVTHICTDKEKPDDSTCKAAIDAMYASLDPTETNKLQALIKIERIALELDVYLYTESE